MFKFNYIKLVLMYSLISISAIAQVPDFLDSSYVPVFQDDFTGTSLDYNKWQRLFPWGPSFTDTNKIKIESSICGVPANTYADLAYDEWHANDTNFVKVNGGSAKIYLNKQVYAGQVWKYSNCPSSLCSFYTAPCFTTNSIPTQTVCVYAKPLTFNYVTTFLYSTQRFKYGYYEIKFKTPPLPSYPQTFKGLGPNFWMLGSDVSLNNAWSEIDIFESHAEDNQLSHTTHYKQIGFSEFSETHPGNYFSGNTWHTGGVLWTNNKIEYFFDGLKVNELADPNIRPDSLAAMALIAGINVQFNGWLMNWCDTIDGTTSLPYVYEIEYIKVWQRKEDCGTTKSFCGNFNPAVYNSKIYNSVSIGGAGCSDQITNTSNLAILGSSFVELKEGFSVDNSSKILMDVVPCITPFVGQRMIPNSDKGPAPQGVKKHYP